MATTSEPALWSNIEVKLLDDWINYGVIIAKMGRQLKEHGHTACEFPARPRTALHCTDNVDTR